MAELSARGVVRGTLAGIAGLAAMAAWSRAATMLRDRHGEDDGSQGEEEEHALDDISITGPHAREGEPSTETVARVAHRALTGHEPDDHRRAALGQVVHWGYGMLMGGLYGAIRDSRARLGFDVGAGLGWGATLWLLGDEVAVPVLGLAKGPTAQPASTHATALGAHLVYGAATAAANRALRHVM